MIDYNITLKESRINAGCAYIETGYVLIGKLLYFFSCLQTIF